MCLVIIFIHQHIEPYICRALGRLKRTVKNKARVEGSIASAYLVREATIFCSHYFEGHAMTKRRVVPRNDDKGAQPGVHMDHVPSIFKIHGRSQGREKAHTLTIAERDVAHSYVMMNCVEMRPYIRFIQLHISYTPLA